MKLGAHISTAAPFSEAIDRAKKSGCECMQIFVNQPQRWNPVPIPEDEIKKFVEKNNKANINPIVIHGIYLINLASSNPFFYEASIRSLIDDMQKAKKIGACGVNFHLGSTRGKKLSEVMEQVVAGVKKILDNSPEGPWLIFENSAGAGDVIGDKFEELAEIIHAVKSDRIKVTLDTAHMFESGYDIRTGEGLQRTLDEFDKTVGLERLVCLHLNGSKTALGSNHDRHANIDDPNIGLEAFRRIVNHPKLKDLPGIIETPELKGRDFVDNLALLKSLRRKL